MGRHRSTLRDLGWATSNSPNPWKLGSAKRIVRALDYGSIEVEEQGPCVDRPAAASVQRGAAAGEDAAGFLQLNRIREQFEAEEAENKGKLERLNGRIAELSDGKRALWSMLSVQQKQKPSDRCADPATMQGPAAANGMTEPDGAILAREEAVVRAEAALCELKAAHADSVAMQDAQLAHREAAVQQAEERIVAKEALAAERMASATRGEAELLETKLALLEREAGIAAREAALAEAEAALHMANTNLKEQEARLSPTRSAIADNPQHLAAARASQLPKDSAPAATDATAPEVVLPVAASGSSAPAKPWPKLVMPWSSIKPPKPPAAAVDNDLVVDRGAEWARADNLALSLVQQSATADDIFCPLAEQQTCKLSDIFSEPRQREREPGSGDWTPLSVAAASTPAWQGGGTKMQLIGVEGEYSGQTVTLPLHFGDQGTFVIGRSSSCEVTLPRDDQISRRHVEGQARDGKLFIRDLGSTYGTSLNGTAVGDDYVQVRPGDVISVGTSSFRLQALVVLAASA